MDPNVITLTKYCRVRILHPGGVFSNSLLHPSLDTFEYERKCLNQAIDTDWDHPALRRAGFGNPYEDVFSLD